MKTAQRTLAAMVVVGSFGLLPGSAQAAVNLCPNFSFEQGPAGTAGFSTFGVGSTAITDWRITAGAVDYFYNFGFVGTRSVDLTAGVGQPGTLETTLITEPGVTYTVDLSAEGTNTQGNTQDRFKSFTVSTVNVGNLAVLLPETTFTVDTAINGNGVFANYGGVMFTATSTATYLRIRSLHTATFDGPTIDNVRVIAVPEGGGLGLSGAVMGIAALRRRR